MESVRNRYYFLSMAVEEQIPLECTSCEKNNMPQCLAYGLTHQKMCDGSFQVIK